MFEFNFHKERLYFRILVNSASVNQAQICS